MGAQRSWVMGILLIAGLVLGGASAPVRAQGHFGLSAGIYQPEEDDADTTEVFGLRGGYRFNPRFGFEAGLSRVDLADAFSFEGPAIPEIHFDFEADVTNFDLSLQWFPGGSDFVVFAGPGIASLDVEVTLSFLGGPAVSESETSEIFTAHAGVGYGWQITDRFFIRPEARVRRYFDDELEEENLGEGLSVSYKATDYEAGVTFGWRFGA